LSDGSSEAHPYYQRSAPKKKSGRIVNKKRKQPIKLPPLPIPADAKVISLPPIRYLKGGRNRSKLVWYICDYCGSYFFVRTARMKKGETGYCDTKCQGKGQSKRLTGRSIPDETRLKISDTKKGIDRKEDVRTKDGESLASYLSAPRNKGWYKKAQDLTTAYRDTGEWKRKSKEIQKRDNNTCQGCGCSRNEVNQMGVHHIKKLADWIYDGNDPSDYPDELLVTLCSNCHGCTEAQPGEYKWPMSSRGDDTRAGFPR
jgi:5-methylcytosine-specific restriction endonuclease McrA